MNSQHHPVDTSVNDLLYLGQHDPLDGSPTGPLSCHPWVAESARYHGTEAVVLCGNTMLIKAHMRSCVAGSRGK
eukprot:1159129-Pelagomonas_calceolata.AAC.9